MGWFGRKSAPDATVCAYAPPPWLAGAHEEGFARSTDGLAATIKSTGETALFRNGAWQIGQVHAASLSIGGEQVVGPQLAAVADPSGGASVDVEARTAIGEILARLRTHGIIAT